MKTISEIIPKWDKIMRTKETINFYQSEMMDEPNFCFVGEAHGKKGDYFTKYNGVDPIKDELVRNPEYCKTCTNLSLEAPKCFRDLEDGTGVILRSKYKAWSKKFERHWNSKHEGKKK